MTLTRRFLLACLPCASALWLAQPSQATPLSVLLIRDGERHALSVDPASLGNRSSWNSYDDVLSAHFVATGPDGDWIVGLTITGGQARDGTLIPPAGPAAAVPDVQVSIGHARIDGLDLDLAGSVSDPVSGLRIEFALTLPRIDFAPTPGPEPVPRPAK